MLLLLRHLVVPHWVLHVASIVRRCTGVLLLRILGFHLASSSGGILRELALVRIRGCRNRDLVELLLWRN